MNRDLILMGCTVLPIRERTEDIRSDQAFDAGFLEGFAQRCCRGCFARIEVSLGNAPSSVSAASDQVAIFRFKVSVITTLLASALADVVWTLAR
ncbi:hypothetical protein J2W42_004155 [Rhizobium tibeticum]|uniref:Uncharacterized protein n=1 Tax=Rhizobium tibeticum TaxID=501024 RepID=A0A1H8T5K8_9HYPH|nr:hypothetical protein [Rhizobium tibeticum]SEI14176.1 hypothetical protein RTCCBAU85039_5045 [Rhizobium tibeticum]SEO86211.1 hypothetical protein SAMN05216228_102763 [Rhizobium tibeticum]